MGFNSGYKGLNNMSHFDETWYKHFPVGGDIKVANLILYV